MKSTLIGLGILLLIDGLIIAYFAGRELMYKTTGNMSSNFYGSLIVATLAIAFLVAGGLTVFFGSKKS
ncbi:MAG: hypothetical protein ABSG33_07470 [Candidatus Bathyarchaeia archaeon]|jgi:hypothetical protein